jgi:AcrR family transcriptional regulator
VAGQPLRERADAKRNRSRVLDAAARLIARQGPEAVSMDAVAQAAGVGKGTLYRRFGDRQGLLLALLDEGERALQDSLLTGPPPLGPGAAPAERLSAFLDALIELLEERGDIIRASETQAPGARVRGGAYAAWHQHVAVLLTEAGAEGDPDVLAHLLLAPLAGETWTSLRDELGLERARLTNALQDVWLTSAFGAA